MKRFETYKLIIVAIAACVVVTLVAVAAIEYGEATRNYRTENVCIQGWVDIGVERRYVHRHNGTCFYSKTTDKWVN